MGESMPRNINSSQMRLSMLTRQKTSQKRAKLRRMKELYASHLSAGGTGAAAGGFDSDGNKSASEDELLQVWGGAMKGLGQCDCCMSYFEYVELKSAYKRVQWSSTLSFEAYHSAWEAVASTANENALNSPNPITTTPLPLSFTGF
jgi:hypothetical protein